MPVPFFSHMFDCWDSPASVPSGTKLNFGKSESMEAEIADHVWSLEEVIALLG